MELVALVLKTSLCLRLGLDQGIVVGCVEGLVGKQKPVAGLLQIGLCIIQIGLGGLDIFDLASEVTDPSTKTVLQQRETSAAHIGGHGDNLHTICSLIDSFADRLVDSSLCSLETSACFDSS